jgi:FHIPEP family protein
MKLADLLPSEDQVKLAEDVERQLLTRRRRGSVYGGLMALLGAIQFVLHTKQETWEGLASFFRTLRDWQWDWDKLQGLAPELFGLAVVLLGFGTYLLARRTAFLMHESREPFRYTFSVSPFALIEDTPGERMTVAGIDRARLLHHDLTEELDSRIGRFMLLDKAGEGEANPGQSLKSHVHIEGHIAVREERDGTWVIHVMPRVRIGPEGSPAILAHTVHYPLGKTEGREIALSPLQYAQLVARVYSRVATAIYKQIDADLEGKIALFPTRYRRAVALYYEADDFSRSNTIDAYDRAAKLYRHALADLRRSPGHWAASLWIRLPLFWRLAVPYVHMRAHIQLGLARCLVARLVISSLTGQASNPIYELAEPLRKLRADMLALHRHFVGYVFDTPERRFRAYLSFPGTWLHRLTRSEEKFDRQRELLFDVFAAEALVYANLQAGRRSNEALSEALATSPPRSETDLTYLWARSANESGRETKLSLLRRILERYPNFQIAQFDVARLIELSFREGDDLSPARAAPVIAEYEKVLRINPGNMSSIAQLGHIHWLIDQPETAARYFNEGMELKGIVPETYVGLLSYGLARVAAEAARFDDSLLHYTEAISAEPSVASNTDSGIRTESRYFESIAPSIVARYRKFLVCTLGHRRRLRGNGHVEPHGVADAVIGHVYNDFGNACLYFGFRWGDKASLQRSAHAFETALRLNRRCAVINYNLTIARGWTGEENPVKDSEVVADAMPAWQPAATNLLYRSTRECVQRLQELRGRIGGNDRELQLRRNEIAAKRRELDGMKASQQSRAPSTSTPPPGLSRADMLGTQLGPGLDAQYKLFELPGDIRALEQKIAEIEIDNKSAHEALNRHMERWEQRIDETASRILDKTKLAPLAQFVSPRAWWSLGRNPSRASGVDSLLDLLNDRSIRWDRLDTLDVRALSQWGDALAYYPRQRQSDAAIRLGQHLLDTYAPEDFDIALWLEQAFTTDVGPAAERTPAEENGRKLLRERCGTIICDRVRQWIESEPAHVYLLQLHHEYFRKAEHVAALDRALAQMPLPDRYRAWLGDWYHSQRQRQVDRGRYREATREQWLSLRADGSSAPMHLAMADTWLLRENRVRAQTGKARARACALKSLETAAALDPANDDAREQLQQLRDRHSLIRVAGDSALQRLPLVTPLAVEVGGNLVAEVSGSAGDSISASLENLLKEMRGRIRAELGVRVPGVRFRDTSGELGSDDYVVIIDEVPVQRGTINRELRYVPRPRAILGNAGIEAEPGRHPYFPGQEGSWVKQADWDKARKAGFELWSNLEYLVRHVEGFIRRTLINFVGHQEVTNLVEDTQQYALRDLLIREPEALDEFTRMLRALVAEGVTIAPLAELGAWWLGRRGRPVNELVRDARMLPRLRRALPGNRGRHALCPLDADFESGLRQFLVGSGDARVLAMPVSACEAVLKSLRAAFDGLTEPVLVVADPDLRAHVRALTNHEWSQVSVLSLPELMPMVSPGLGAPIVAPPELVAGVTP